MPAVKRQTQPRIVVELHCGFGPHRYKGERIIPRDAYRQIGTFELGSLGSEVHVGRAANQQNALTTDGDGLVSRMHLIVKRVGEDRVSVDNLGTHGTYHEGVKLPKGPRMYGFGNGDLHFFFGEKHKLVLKLITEPGPEGKK